MAQRPGREIEDYRGWLAQAKLYQGDDYFRLCGAGEYTEWAAGDNTNFAKDPVVQPPIMEESIRATARPRAPTMRLGSRRRG